MIEATGAVLEVARRRGLARIFTAYAMNEEGTDGGILVQKFPALLDLRVGTRLVEIDARLNRQPSEPVVHKQGFSGLAGTRALSLLLAARTDTVVLCGTTTSGCIRATAIDLIQAGLPALVPQEAVGDRTESVHRTNLFDIDAKHADVVALTEVIEYLESVPDPS